MGPAHGERHRRHVGGVDRRRLAARRLPGADMLARAQDRPLSAEGQRVMAKVGPIGQPPSLRATRTRRAPAELAATLARAARRPFSARPLALLAALAPEGSISTDLISVGMEGLFPDDWPTAPLWICAVRQDDGRRVVFGRGKERPPVPDAIAASCAIPVVLQPGRHRWPRLHRRRRPLAHQRGRAA